MPSGKYPRPSLLDRFWKFVEIQPNGCWSWTGNLNQDGYPILSVSNKNKGAHRVSFELFRGPIPLGLQLDHTCHNPQECPGGKSCPHRRCVNPDHVETCTGSVNRSRERSVCNTNPAILSSLAERSARTQCRNGHEYSDANSYFWKGWRRCRVCNTNSVRRLRNVPILTVDIYTARQ